MYETSSQESVVRGRNLANEIASPDKSGLAMTGGEGEEIAALRLTAMTMGVEGGEIVPYSS